jgi:hypothetical protein
MERALTYRWSTANKVNKVILESKASALGECQSYSIFRLGSIQKNKHKGQP